MSQRASRKKRSLKFRKYHLRFFGVEASWATSSTLKSSLLPSQSCPASQSPKKKKPGKKKVAMRKLKRSLCGTGVLQLLRDPNHRSLPQLTCLPSMCQRHPFKCLPGNSSQQVPSSKSTLATSTTLALSLREWQGSTQRIWTKLRRIANLTTLKLWSKSRTNSMSRSAVIR